MAAQVNCTKAVRVVKFSCDENTVSFTISLAVYLQLHLAHNILPQTMKLYKVMIICDVSTLHQYKFVYPCYLGHWPYRFVHLQSKRKCKNSQNSDPPKINKECCYLHDCQRSRNLRTRLV